MLEKLENLEELLNLKKEWNPMDIYLPEFDLMDFPQAPRPSCWYRFISDHVGYCFHYSDEVFRDGIPCNPLLLFALSARFLQVAASFCFNGRTIPESLCYSVARYDEGDVICE